VVWLRCCLNHDFLSLVDADKSPGANGTTSSGLANCLPAGCSRKKKRGVRRGVDQVLLLQQLGVVYMPHFQEDSLDQWCGSSDSVQKNHC